MSLYDVTQAVEDYLRGGDLSYCTIVDVYLDDGDFHYSDMFHEITVNDGSGNVTYTPMGTRLIAPDRIEGQTSLDPTSFDIYLDSSRISDDSDIVGALIDKNLMQRQVRVQTLDFVPNTNRTTPLWLSNVRYGIINGIEDDIGIGDQSAVKLTIASGTFAFLERRNITYSHASQTDLFAGDTGFERLPLLVNTKLPWRGKFRT